jgi:hydrogenase-4 component F
MLIALILIPLLAAALLTLARRRNVLETIHIAATLSLLGAGMSVCIPALRSNQAGTLGADAVAALGGLLRVDALSAMMVGLIAGLGTIAALYAIGYARAEFDQAHQSRARMFFALFHIFIAAMLIAVTTDNLGVMWVAVEGTTLATVFLVNLHNSPTSLEAAYKYLILSSVGIALAFIGTVLMYYAGAAHAGEIALNWTALHAAAPTLSPQVVRLAFAFILIGYGTKAGLAPMHTWLPDAHSEAPAPISALMSGVLLNVGLYALMRFKAVTDAAVGATFANRWLMGMGLLSMAIAAVFLLRQSNYKRMLAYSSVEHIGIISMGLGFGGYWGTLGAVLHVINHALTKSALFILSGNIWLKYRTTEIRRVRGLLRSAPLTGGAFLAGILALLGLPPFGLFLSEFIIFGAGLTGATPAVAVAGITLLAVVFAGMLTSLHQILYGAPLEKSEPGDPLTWSVAPLAINFALLLVLGLTLPPVLLGPLERVLKILGQ